MQVLVIVIHELLRRLNPTVFNKYLEVIEYKQYLQFGT